uniref:Putative calcium uptake protein 1 log mitochondrial n=1 Tax=Anopheles darlingi TaxID=43151 RepID=A0A2M4CP86_ANODA
MAWLLRHVCGGTVLYRSGALLPVKPGSCPIVWRTGGLSTAQQRYLATLGTGKRAVAILAPSAGTLEPKSWQEFNHRGGQQSRGYKNFGHQHEKEPLYTRLFYIFICTMMVGSCLDWKRLASAIGWPKVDADAGVEMGKKDDASSSSSELNQEEDDSEGGDGEVDAQGRKKSRKEKIGFRDRKVMSDG